MTSDIPPEVPQPGARALASRRNGASSRGPQTAAGLARSSGNALKHGLRARRQVLLEDEDASEYRAFQAAARTELAPAGARRSGATSGGRPWEPGAQSELAARIVTTAWRARRADRLEAALLGRYLGADARQAGDAQEALGTGLIRDGNGPRALETRWPEPAPTSSGRCAPTNRYRGSVLAELARRSAPTLVVGAGSQVRALAALKVLQADARELPNTNAPDAAPAILPPPRATTKRTREVLAKQPLSLQDTP